MGSFHVLQLLLAGVAIAVAVRALRRLYPAGGMDAPSVAMTVDLLATEAGSPAALELARRLPADPFVDFVRCSLTSDPQGVLLHDELYARQFEGVAALRSLARMALPLAFLAGILELSAAFSGGEGLVALQQGLAAHIALQAALLSFAIGLGTSLFAATAAALLQRRGRERLAALDAVLRTSARLR